MLQVRGELSGHNLEVLSNEKWWTENALNEAETQGQKDIPESLRVFCSQETGSIDIFYRSEINVIE